MYLIEQAREIPQLLRNWQSFKLTKFVVVVVWCQFHFLKTKPKKKRKNPLTLIDDLLVALVPDYPGLGPGVPGSAADLPLCPGIHGDPRVRVDQLQLGGRNWKIFGLTWNSNDYIWGWDDGLWCGNSPVPGQLLLLCNYTSIMATTTTTISHAFA